MGGGPEARQSGLATIPAGRYEPDPNHAYLSFSYSHLGLSHPQLRFTDFVAVLDLDATSMGNSRAETG